MDEKTTTIVDLLVGISSVHLHSKFCIYLIKFSYYEENITFNSGDAIGLNSVGEHGLWPGRREGGSV